MNPRIEVEGNHPSQKLTPQNALDAVAQATTRVATSLLERNGIDSLRILSETQFLDLLSRMQTRKNIQRTGDPDAFGLSDPSDAEHVKALESRWLKLKSKHEQSLSTIEGRMEKLARAFSGIQGVVEKLEPNAPAHVTEIETKTLPQGDSSKHKSLLRQLLLTGDEPGSR